MKRNKKVFEGMTVMASLLVMTSYTAFGSSAEDSTGAAQTVAALDKNATAGIIGQLGNMESNAISESKFMTASIEKTEKTMVASGVIAELAGENSNSELVSREEATAETAATEEIQEPTNEIAEEVVPQMNELPSEEMTAERDEVQTQEFAQNADEAQTEEVQQENEEAPAEEQQESEEVTEEAPQETEETQTEEVTQETDEAQTEESTEETEEEPVSEEEAAWENLVMANVEKEMNIRTSPDETSELSGKFYRGDVAEVVSVGDEWTEITSGNATGYVKNDYLVFGTDAYNLANEVCSLYATVEADGLRLRREPSEEADVVTMAANGDKLKVNKEAEAQDGWVAVYTSDATAYVSADYVGVELNLGTALNSEEVAAKEAEEAKEAEKAKKPAVNAGADEVTLLGALIQCEAGSGSYDGMVAVGSVVMNRVRSGSYPNSISGVIHQGGQFTPAGRAASMAASGNVSGACLQAAREAIAGTDNTNGALSFRSGASGHAGTLIGANVFF